jgi:DNA replication protein DnaC
MPRPATWREALDGLVDELRRRGVDIDAPLDDTDPYDEQQQRSLALAYTDANTPARFSAAVADEPDVIDWARQVIDRAVADSAGHVQRFVRTGPSLLILGSTGVGKTHQAYGALRLIAQAGVRARWVSTTAADFYARLRPRHGVDSETEFRAVADAPILVFDDLAAAKDSEWVEAVNYRLVNWRYDRELATIVTSNLEPEELAAALDDRVASRLRQLAKKVSIKGADRRAGLRPS